MKTWESCLTIFNNKITMRIYQLLKASEEEKLLSIILKLFKTIHIQNILVNRFWKARLLRKSKQTKKMLKSSRNLRLLKMCNWQCH